MTSPDPLHLLSALASTTRIALLGALVSTGPARPDALAAATGISIRDVQKGIGTLAAVGLVDRDQDGALVARVQVVRAAVDAATAATPLGRVLADFPSVRSSTHLGRIVSLPPNARTRRELGGAVLAALGPFREASEPELNDRLSTMTDDVANLRRLLVDEGMLERTADGRRYWRP